MGKPFAVDVPSLHQYRIAKDTLRLSDAGAKIMGGMTKDEAKTFLRDRARWSNARIARWETAERRPHRTSKEH